MKRRRRKTSGFYVNFKFSSFRFRFPRLRWKKLKHQILILICLFIMISIVEEPRLAIFMGLTALVAIFVVYGYKVYWRNLILKSDIQKIDSMSGEDFEIYLEQLFKKRGYKVFRTPISGDFGADLILDNGEIKAAVQAKRYNNKIGLAAVQEVVAAKLHYGCKDGIVITNNYFTPQAETLAESNGITLWNRDYLIKQILAVKKETENRVSEEC